MGLDIYMRFRKHVSRYDYSEQPIKENPEYNSVVQALGLSDEDTLNGTSLEVFATFGYWRKANHIHNWFVEKLMGGLDECQLVPVNSDAIAELRKTCMEVIQDPGKGPELLPTKSGFFFGSTEYDESYLQDIKYTVEVLDKAAELIKKGYGIYYRASW